MQRVEQLSGELVTTDALRRQQVGPADVADEQRVTGEYGERLGIGRPLPDDDADRLGRVPGRVAHLEDDLAELDALAVGELARLELGVGGRAVGDRRPCRRRQLEVTGEEVGVEVRLDDELDRQVVLDGGVQVRRHVAARVDDHRPSRARIADQVGRL